MEIGSPLDIDVLEKNSHFKALVLLGKSDSSSAQVLDIITALPSQFAVVTLEHQKVKEAEIGRLYDLVNHMKPLIINAINLPPEKIISFGYLSAIGYNVSTVLLESETRSVIELNREKHYLHSHSSIQDLLVLNCDNNNLTTEVKELFIKRVINFFSKHKSSVISNRALNKLIESGDENLVPVVYPRPWFQEMIKRIGGF